MASSGGESPAVMFRRLTGAQEYDKFDLLLNDRQRELDRARDILSYKKSTKDREADGMSFLSKFQQDAKATQEKQAARSDQGAIPSADIQPGRADGVKDARTSVVGKGILDAIVGKATQGTTTSQVGTQAATQAGDVVPGGEGRLAAGAGVYQLNEGVNAPDPAGGRPNIRIDKETRPTFLGASRAGIAATLLFHMIGKGTQTSIIERDVSMTESEREHLNQRTKEWRHANALQVMKDYPGASVIDAMEMQSAYASGDVAMGNVPQSKLSKWEKLQTRKDLWDERRYGLAKRRLDNDDKSLELQRFNSRVNLWGKEWDRYIQWMGANPDKATMPDLVNMLGYTGEAFKNDSPKQLADALREGKERGVEKMSPLEISNLGARVAAKHGKILTFNEDEIGLFGLLEGDVPGSAMNQQEFLLKMDIATGKTPSADRAAVIRDLKRRGLGKRGVDAEGNETIVRLDPKDGNQHGFSGQLFDMYEFFTDTPVGQMWRGEQIQQMSPTVPMPSLQPPSLPGSPQAGRQPLQQRRIAPQAAPVARPAQAKQATAVKQKVAEKTVLEKQKAIGEQSVGTIIDGIIKDFVY